MPTPLHHALDSSPNTPSVPACATGKEKTQRHILGPEKPLLRLTAKRKSQLLHRLKQLNSLQAGRPRDALRPRPAPP